MLRLLRQQTAGMGPERDTLLRFDGYHILYIYNNYKYKLGCPSLHYTALGAGVTALLRPLSPNMYENTSSNILCDLWNYLWSPSCSETVPAWNDGCIAGRRHQFVG
jgi:hypothetical protein